MRVAACAERGRSAEVFDANHEGRRAGEASWEQTPIGLQRRQEERAAEQERLEVRRLIAARLAALSRSDAARPARRNTHLQPGEAAYPVGIVWRGCYRIAIRSASQFAACASSGLYVMPCAVWTA